MSSSARSLIVSLNRLGTIGPELVEELPTVETARDPHEVALLAAAQVLARRTDVQGMWILVEEQQDGAVVAVASLPLDAPTAAAKPAKAKRPSTRKPALSAGDKEAVRLHSEMVTRVSESMYHMCSDVSRRSGWVHITGDTGWEPRTVSLRAVAEGIEIQCEGQQALLRGQDPYAKELFSQVSRLLPYGVVEFEPGWERSGTNGYLGPAPYADRADMRRRIGLKHVAEQASEAAASAGHELSHLRALPLSVERDALIAAQREVFGEAWEAARRAAYDAHKADFDILVEPLNEFRRDPGQDGVHPADRPMQLALDARYALEAPPAPAPTAPEPEVAPEPAGHDEPVEAPSPSAGRWPTWTGPELRAWRDRMGWTQTLAADQLRMHKQAYAKLEQGRKGGAPIRPAIRHLAELLEAAPRRPVGRAAEPAPVAAPTPQAMPLQPHHPADEALMVAVAGHAVAVAQLTEAVIRQQQTRPHYEAVNAAADVVDPAREAEGVTEAARRAAGATTLAANAALLAVRFINAARGLGGREQVTVAADARNGTIGDTTMTLQATGGEGRGVSLNSVPLVVSASAVEEVISLDRSPLEHGAEDEDDTVSEFLMELLGDAADEPSEAPAPAAQPATEATPSFPRPRFLKPAGSA